MTDDAAGKPRKKSRSDYLRGPQKTRSSRKARSAVPKRVVPYGGFGLEEAARHMDNFDPASRTDHGDELHFTLTRTLVVTARRWRKLANERVKHLGQTMARLEALYLVAYSGQDLNQGELARLISVEGPTMVHMLNSLAQEGLIERHQSETDRRVTINRITERGQAKIHEIMRELSMIREEVYRDFDRQRLQDTILVLDEILTKLDRMR